jgi:two-component system chemotaxis response regulator CheY
MPAASKLTVVVVDDQMTIRSLVRTGLNQIAINEVREFGAAEEALTYIKVHAPNVVISDFNMPGMDGLALLEGIRADEKLKKTAFILLTGRAEKELVQRAVQLGANNYLVKPFNIATLKQKIEQVVGALT